MARDLPGWSWRVGVCLREYSRMGLALAAQHVPAVGHLRDARGRMLGSE